MKKVIAILAIMLVIVGAVFAAETHTIKLKTQVGGEVPAFQLSYVSGGIGSAASATNVASSTVAMYQYGDANSPDSFAGDDIEVLDISENDITVKFSALLANDAKRKNEVYNVTLEAGAFSVLRSGIQGELAASSQAVAVSTTLAARLGIDTTASALQSDAKTVKLVFNGAECVAGEVATLTATYTKDASIDMNAAGEFYYAPITMTVTKD